MTSIDQRSGAGEKTLSSTIPVAVVGLAGLFLFLGWKNVGLRGDVVREGRAVKALEDTLSWNIKLSAIEGALLPEFLTKDLGAGMGLRADQQSPEILLVIYTPTVCVTCLRAGLRSIQDRRSDLENEGISPHVLIGERRGAREFALLLHEDGLLEFPTTFVPAEMILNGFPFSREPRFTETPLYLLLDRDFKIRSAFKADQRRPVLLDQWLAALRSPVEWSSDENQN